MNMLGRVVAPVLVALHALIHLIGAVVYLQLGRIEGFPYKTTVLNGRWDLGDGGIRVFGVLWLVTAAGLVVSAVGLFYDSAWWPPMLAAFVLWSLVLTGLDWSVAWVGVGTNILILLVLVLAVWGTT